MKKSLKRVAALLLALMMVLQSGIVSPKLLKEIFAEPTEASDVTYTVTFNCDGKLYHQKKVKAGDTVGKLPIVEDRNGYDFSGWFEEGGGEVTPQTVVTRNMTVNAVFKLRTYTVTFLYEGAYYTAKTVAEGRTLGNLPLVLDIAGYRFIGWFTEDGRELTTETVIRSNMTVHARFEAMQSSEPTPVTPNEPTGETPDEPVGQTP